MAVEENEINQVSTKVKASAKPSTSLPEEDSELKIGALRAMKWANQRRIPIVVGIIALALGGGGYFGYQYYRNHREEQASSSIAKGLWAELSPLKEEKMDPEAIRRLTLYANEAEKQNAAIGAYQNVRAKYADLGPGILAKLGEAGIRLDKGEFDASIAAYQEVQSTALAKADANVRMQCLEGLGYAYEGKGQLDDARRSFEMLSNLDARGAKPLGLYHLARIDVAKNDNVAAIQKLKTARGLVQNPVGLSSQYLKEQIDGFLGKLDPSAVPRGGPGGGLGAGKYSKEQIEAIMKQIQSGKKP